MTEPVPFIVYALPRSRTFWLSRYLSCGAWHCGHDELRHARSLDDVKTWLSLPYTGTVETLAAPWWRLVQDMRPDIKTVVVRRPVAEVVDSCMRLGLPFNRDRLTANMTRLDHKLDQIETRVPGVLSVAFDDLSDQSVCASVFAHCLSAEQKPDRWRIFDDVNLQTSMPVAVRYMAAYQQSLDRLAKTAKQRVLAGMTRDEPDIDGVTCQQEPFETAFQDSQALIADHLVRVGESPDGIGGKNIDLMRHLDKAGRMQITTARSNGRMFGYLMTVFGPSMEHADSTEFEALNLTFYASPLIRGLGMKLQRSSNDALRRRGINTVFLRAGVRGTGPRMGTLYRRLGAEDYGQMFKLDLKAS